MQLHHALKHGMPDGEQLRFFKNFVVCFDARMRNPRWVLEHITREQTRGDGNRFARLKKFTAKTDRSFMTRISHEGMPQSSKKVVSSMTLLYRLAQ